MRPLLVAAAVIFHQGRVLLTKRQRGSHLAGYWEFPGGKLEPGESPEDAVVRECREECGIDIRVEDIFEVTFHSYPSKDVLLLFYRCELVQGTVRHLEVDDHVWCSPADIRRYPLPPADARLIDKIEQRLG